MHANIFTSNSDYFQFSIVFFFFNSLNVFSLFLSLYQVVNLSPILVEMSGPTLKRKYPISNEIGSRWQKKQKEQKNLENPLGERVTVAKKSVQLLRSV